MSEHITKMAKGKSKKPMMFGKAKSTGKSKFNLFKKKTMVEDSDSDYA